jgi:folate-binding protein YgfZ
MATILEPAIVPSPPGDTSVQLSSLLHGAGIAPLDDIGWIRVTGEDRVRWLNGMVTNSIVGLAPGEGCYNFVLNAQGRIQGDLTAFAEPNALLLKTDRRRLPGLVALLDRFIIMDDVELADVSAERAGVSVAGPQAAALLEQIGLPAHKLSAIRSQTSSWCGLSIMMLQENSPLVPRFEVWAAPEAGEAIREALLHGGATACDADAFEDLRILEGTPLYGTDIRNSETARDLPQETGQTRALHFTKGCYLGQEIVERIRSRGTVHRTFGGFQLTGTLPAVGAALEAEGKTVGELTSIAAIPLASGVVQLALGYIRREALDRGLALQYPGGVGAPVILPWPRI